MWPFRKNPVPVEPPSPPAPERLTYVIGDIHGCRDALDTLLLLINEDRANRPADIVFVGDYSDRGPDSAGVLTLLSQMAETSVCLLGNHDRMMLDFLDDPARNGPRWLHFGGQDTLRSYGIINAKGTSADERCEHQAAALTRAMGPGLIDWLRDRPLWWQSGTLIAVHALTETTKPMTQQTEKTLIWGRPDKKLRPRSDGNWVVHGHTIVATPTSVNGHVNVDTGAFQTGHLTAAVFDGTAPRFLST
jgi:serine/threonine protein phosphatase 1